MMWIFSILLMAQLQGSPAAATEGTLHLIKDEPSQQQPTLPESMIGRIRDAAREYARYAPVPRVAFQDLAMPGNDAELLATHGYGVLLVTVLSQDATELPPKRVFVSWKGTELPLERLAGTTSTVARDPEVARVLGTHRWDGLYLFPVGLLRDGSSVKIDLAAHREGFVLAEYTDAVLAEQHYRHPPPPSPPAEPDARDAIMKLIAREFPGFLRQE